MYCWTVLYLTYAWKCPCAWLQRIVGWACQSLSQLHATPRETKASREGSKVFVWSVEPRCQDVVLSNNALFCRQYQYQYLVNGYQYQYLVNGACAGCSQLHSGKFYFILLLVLSLILSLFFILLLPVSLMANVGTTQFSAEVTGICHVLYTSKCVLGILNSYAMV